jgi:thioesterase domain-containing protein
VSTTAPWPHADSFGVDFLQRLLTDEFPLVKHIGIEVESAHDGGVVLAAPFEPNSNFKGTAFGGSLFCVALLAGWSWVTRDLARRGIVADAVIQESTIRYVSPVQGELRAVLKAPSAGESEKFRRMLKRAGRGRIRLRVDIRDGQALGAEFDGVFAAIAR